jgi:excisionase family DNA binding protein
MAKPTLIELLNTKIAITPNELADTQELPISRGKVYEAIKRGDIPSIKFGKKIAIPSAALKAKFSL